MTWLLLVGGVLAVWRGVLPRHDGIWPRALWRNERDLRRPGRIWRRWCRVLAAAGLLAGACVAGVALVAVVLLAAGGALVAGLAWYVLRVGANWAEPRMTAADCRVLGRHADGDCRHLLDDDQDLDHPAAPLGEVVPMRTRPEIA